MKKQTIVMYKEAVADDDLCVGFECSLCCGTYYRSKANYVDALREMSTGERDKWNTISFHNSGCTHGSYKRSP